MSGLREIGIVYDPEEAFVVKSYLQANGFFAVLGDSGMLMQSPMDRIALGGFRIMVPASEAEEAKQLFQKARKQPNEAALACPTCGKTDYRRVKSWWFPAIFFVFLGGVVPFATNSRYLECRACKTRIQKSVEA